MYLLIASGLALTIWPEVIAHEASAATPSTVVSALLAALAVMCLAGLRYPVRMLPILIFELLWKLIWVISYALPARLSGQVDAYTSETFFACMVGIVLVPIVIPWRYVFRIYLLAEGDAWKRPMNDSGNQA